LVATTRANRQAITARESVKAAGSVTGGETYRNRIGDADAPSKLLGHSRFSKDGRCLGWSLPLWTSESALDERDYIIRG
jgi:hypothetical protein